MMQPAMAKKRMARRGFELHVSRLRQIGENDGHLQTAGDSERSEQRGASLAIRLLGKEASSRVMNTDEPGVGCFFRVQSGKLEKRKKMWGRRLGCPLGTTSRAVPPAAGLSCGGSARHSANEKAPWQKNVETDRPAYER